MESPEISRANRRNKTIDYRIRYNTLKDSSFGEAVIEALWANGLGTVKKSDLIHSIFITYSYDDLTHLVKSHQQKLVAEAEQMVACLYKVANAFWGSGE